MNSCLKFSGIDDYIIVDDKVVDTNLWDLGK